MFLFTELSHWSWLVLGLLLLCIELLAPFTFFLWLGASALCTALIAFFAPNLGWEMQVTLFAVLSVLSIWLSHRYLAHRQTRSESPNLNRRGQQYIGRTFILAEAIENGYGKISVDDSQWQVSGAPQEQGGRVKVVGCEGVVLKVEAVE